MKNILKGLQTITVNQNYPKVVVNPTMEDAVKNIIRVSKNTDLDASVINNNTAVFEKAIKKLSSKHNGFVVLSVAAGVFVVCAVGTIMAKQEDDLNELKKELIELKSKSEPEEWETTEE